MKRFLLIFFGLLIVIGLSIALALLLPPRAETYDFVMLYTADLGILNRVPIYDTPALQALTIAKTAAEAGKFTLFPYPYPPWFALSTFYLAWLPPRVAANAWLFLNIAMLVTAIALLTRGWKPMQRILALLAGLLFIPSLGLVVVGQYSMPVLLGAALFYDSARRQDAPLSALGLLLVTFKPHIGVIMFGAGFLWLLFHKTPFARRALWMTIGGGLAFVTLGFLADPAWPLTYIKALLGYSTIPGVENRDLTASFSVAIVKMLMGRSITSWAYLLSLALIIFLAILFWRKGIFSSPASLVMAAAIMTLLGDPYMFNYDYILMLIPLFVLFAQSKSIVERVILGGVYFVPWLTLAVGVGGNILLNLAALVMLGMLVFKPLPSSSGLENEGRTG